MNLETFYLMMFVAVIWAQLKLVVANGVVGGGGVHCAFRWVSIHFNASKKKLTRVDSYAQSHKIIQHKPLYK